MIHAIILFILSINITFLTQASAETLPTTKESNSLKLYQLDNTTLIEQANQLFEQARSSFHQQVRAFFHINEKFKQANIATNQLEITKTKITLASTATLNELQQTLKIINTNIDKLQHRYLLLETEHKLLKQSIFEIELVLQSLEIFLASLKQLESYVLEALWRIKDGSLLEKQRPKLLTNSYLNKQQQNIKQQVKLWQQRLSDTNDKLTKNAQQLRDTQQAIAESKQQQKLLTEQHNRESQRKTLEKQYQSQQPQQLLLQLQQLQSERIWFNGAFSLSNSQFQQTQNKIKQIQLELASLKKPVSTDILTFQIDSRDEIKAGIQQLNAIVSYHQQHQTLLQNLQTQLKIILEQARSVNNKSAVLMQHLFNMEVLSATLETVLKQTNQNNIPASLQHKQLKADSQKINTASKVALTAIQQSEQQFTDLAEQVLEDQNIQQQANLRLKFLEKTLATLQQEESLNNKLSALNIKEIIQLYQDYSETLQATKRQTEVTKKQFIQAQIMRFDAEQAFITIEGPLLRIAHDESFAEQQAIFNQLYQLSNLTPANSKLAVISTSKKSQTDDNLQKQQNLLSARINMLKKQQQQHQQLIESQQSELKQLEIYLKALNDLLDKTQQYYAYAVEIQKRIGLGEINGNQAPTDLLEALQQQPISKIKNEISKQLNQQAYLQQQLELLNQPASEQSEEIDKLETILLLIGERINSLQLAHKYNQESQQDRSKLSQTKIKTLEQTALRNMEKDDSISESFFNFFPSERADSLTTLLHDYYQEMIFLENKQTFYADESKAIEQALRQTEQEKEHINTLLPIIKTNIQRYKRLKEQALVQIKSRLKPEQASVWLQEFADKYQQKLPNPIPVTDKEATIQRAAQQIFFYHVQMLAAQKLQVILQNQQSSNGLVQDIDNYRDQLDQLDAKIKTLLRQITYLQASQATVRKQRYQLRQQVANWVMMKLIIVFLLTIIVHILIRQIIILMLKRYQRLAENSQAKEKYDQMSVLLPFIKISLLIIIWLVALMVTLNSLGVDIAAILAGLGIGGLALAMALKSTLSDVIGGINIVITRAFKVGDRIKLNGEEAIVKKIGLRYTQVSDFSYNYIISVPNSLLREAEIINASAHSGCIILTNVHLSILNTANKVRLALELIEKIIQNHQQARFIWVKHDHFDGHAFVLRINYDILQFKDRAWVETEINVEIVKQLQQHDIKFAHRVQTDYN
jgi:MscS family membrane protein